MRIEVIKTEVESKGKYSVLTVSYRGPDGKVEQKKLMSFGPASTAYKVLKDASPNDVFEVKSEQVKNEKDGKDYWYWTEAVVTGKVDPNAVRTTPSGSSPSPRSTYETAEERAKKQVYIVRQSSISNAIDTFALGKKTPSREEVVDLAKFYEAYVFDTYIDESVIGLPDIEVK